jgi:hypothetical protein
MKRLIYILIIPLIINAQDIAGTYKLTGIYEHRQQISKYEMPIVVSDTHGLGVTIQVSTIPQGQPYQWVVWGPFGEEYLQAVTVNLSITFYPDGSGYMEGWYPIEGTDEEECYTDLQVLPVMDYFIYNSSLSAGLEIPYSSIMGPLNYQSPFMGETAGILGFTGSVFFPDLPAYPVQPNLCDGAGNCFDLDLSSLDGEFVSGGDPLPGTTGGYVLKGNLPSFLVDQGNEYSNLYLEYFAIDGAISGLGLGEIVGVDEDGDGTDFDRIGSIPALTATYVDPGCGFNYPIWGDVTLSFESAGLGSCINEVSLASSGYIYDPSFAPWSNLLTYNSVMFSLTQDQQYLTDDSDHDETAINAIIIMITIISQILLILS